jgi:polyisoprenoid-binding protein YceI
MRKKQLLFGLIGAAALLVIAASIGLAYFVGVGGNSPAALTVRPTASPSSTTSASNSDPAGDWKVSSGSQAGYRVREQLAGLPAPSDAVGRTSKISGTISVSGSPAQYAITSGSFTVDVSTLTSDRSMRDQRIHNMGLESSRYPTSTFVLINPISLPSTAGSGQMFQVSATGNLTIHGLTKPVTIPLTAQVAGSRVQVSGSVTFPWSDFGMEAPNVGGFVSVQDHVTMEFALNLVKA